MSEKKVAGIIPARFGSSRLPGKPLADIAGKPMIQHVYEQCSKAVLLHELWIATDDERICHAVRNFNGNVMMTRPDHCCGTDRIAEAAADMDADIIVNIQGDQPFIDPGMIDQVVAPLLANPAVQIATLKKPVEEEAALHDPAVVKTVTDLTGRALYFSRSLIPYPREKTNLRIYEHIGLYAYTKAVLLQITRLQPTALEKTESLEQLRWLEHGYLIQVETATDSDPLFHGFSVDTEADLLRAAELYKDRMNSF